MAVPLSVKPFRESWRDSAVASADIILTGGQKLGGLASHLIYMPYSLFSFG